jgi:hypothetical protein
MFGEYDAWVDTLHPNWVLLIFEEFAENVK